MWSDGREVRFTKTKEGFQPPSDCFDQLIKNPDGTFQLRTRENLLYRFDSKAHGQLTSMADPHGALVQLLYSDFRPYRLEKVVDRYKNTLTFTYDGMGRLEEVTDSVGRKAQYKHDVVRNLLVRTTDPLGYQAEYRYDRDGNLSEQTFPDGVKLINKYDKAHRVIAQSNQALANIFTFRYFDKERRIEARAWGGRLTQYQYDEKGHITEILDPLGRRTVSRYDERGHLTERVGPKGDRWRFRYDGKGNLIEARGPLGFSWRAEYDEKWNQPIKMVVPGGMTARMGYTAKGDLAWLEKSTGGQKSFAYDGFGHLVQEKDTLGRVTEWKWDAKGNMISSTRFLGDSSDPATRVTSHYTCDNRGNILVEEDPLGRKIQREVDLKNRVMREVRVEKRTTVFSYDAFDNVVSHTDPAGAITHFTVAPDWWNHLASVENPLGAKTLCQYDPLGNLTAVVDPLGWQTKYRYNKANQLVAIRFPSGAAYRLDYDAQGNIRSIVDPLGRKTLYRRDLLGRIVLVKRANGASVGYRYDHADHVVEVLDSLKRPLRFSYDPRGMLLSEQDSLGHSKTYRYDLEGRLVARTNARGQTLNFSYDNLDRLLRVEGAGSKPVRYANDKAGNMISAKGDEDIQWEYDDFDQAIRIKRPERELTVEYSYDPRGLRTLMKDSLGQEIAYTYDAAGRLVQMQAGQDAYLFGYDALDRLVKTTLPNGVVTSSVFDAQGNVSEMVSKAVSGKVVAQRQYVYDPVGNLVQETSLEEQHRYCYDPIDQLMEASDAASTLKYEYDLVGNRMSAMNGSQRKTYRYNHANELIQEEGPEGKTDYEYDADGNLVLEKFLSPGVLSPLPSGDRASVGGAFSYDALNFLIEAKGADGIKEKISYDPLGRRSMLSRKGATQRFLYDGLNVIAQLDENNHPTQRYFHGAGIDEVLGFSRGDQKYYFLTDHLGSVRHALDKSGTVQESYRYDSFGVPTFVGVDGKTRNTSALSNPYLFTGREYMPTLGLYYYRMRHYAPALSRFTSPDPLRIFDGANKYPYVRNNPVKFVDPLGLYNEDVHEYKTFTWAVSVGFTQSAATTIADQDQGMDEGWSHPYNPFGGTQQHFRNRGDVIVDLDNAIKKGNLEAFGRNMHSLQDSFSHAGYEWWKGGHLKDGHAPDKYDPNSTRDKVMEKWTKYFMKRYLEKNKKKICK